MSTTAHNVDARERAPSPEQGVLELALEDGEFVVYRSGAAADTSRAHSFLVVMPRSEHPRPQAIRMLENEYSLRDELNPAWAIRSLAQTTHESRPALILEDPGGELLVQRAIRQMDVGEALRIGAGLANALRQLHSRCLIHKDIKPANVMIDGTTGQVWLRGFGIASRLPRERRLPEPPEFIAGTLAYMAPEQTGWMNRSIDARSDLYSLGVVLYELLTGSLPFTAAEPMAWVHAHIAGRPMPPAELRQGIPGVVSAIVMKLLAKTAEDRYQTAAALERDLRRCLAHLDGDGRIDAFALAQDDTPDRLVIPEKLYGRAREIDTLLAAFERVVTSGMPELVLVSGYSGIGKSSVVNELHKVLVPPRGLFGSGKFDQYKRDIPYTTLAQAFQILVRYLLGKSDVELSGWREGLVAALGPNGLLMIDLVPELKLIIGDQPPVPELAPQDARRRFQLVFRRFIGVFARQDHPLTLFLDDLQWLDAATLDLLEDLLTPPGVPHLMLIGAYRDNEVTAAHPLMRTLDAIRSAGANAHEITLAPLAADDATQLIADALRCEPERAAPLARLVHEKTGGNPFFLIQFLHTLAEEGWLAFDHEKGRWSWDLNRIHAKRHRDNIVDLMVGRLNRLPLDTQKALAQLACLGNIAPLRMLSFALGKSPEEVSADLWDAVRLELVEHVEGFYKFVHDRVQEAAYLLIPEELRNETHLRIGRQLTARIPSEEREEAIFDIVNQFNRGAALITSRDERDQVAELNLLAGTRAKASTAYASALKYLVAGAALLSGNPWERRHELIFALDLHRAECEFHTGALAAAEERLNLLSARAANTVERARVASLRVDVYTTLDNSERAVEVCLEYLAHLGVEWPSHPTHEQALEEYQRIWSRLGARRIEDLIDLPLMSDPETLGTMDVLNDVVPPALFTDRNLLSLVICRMVNLSFEHGNSDASCFAYVFLGMIAGPHFDNYAGGFQFGRLGYELVERRGLHRYQARTYMAFGNFVMPWTKHVRAGRDLVRRAFDIANKAGDLTFAAYSCNNLNTNLLAAGDRLADVQREAEQGLDFAQKARFGLVIDIITAQLGLIRTLRGLTPAFGTFDDEQFNERRFESHLASQPDLALPACWYWIRKLQARVLAGDFRSAIDAALKAQPLLWTSPSFFETAEYEFYGGLARAGFCSSISAEEQPQHRDALSAHHRQLEIWAKHCPENFESRAALVGAEIARIDGRVVNAEQLYEQAIRSAHEHGFVQNEGLAYELAARFYAARTFDDFAHLYLRRARECYARWGADGKVRQLDERYPRLRDEEPVPDSRTTIGEAVERLELATVLRVSQAVSGEMNLERLLDKLMRAAIEHAGAERGLLIAPRGDELQIQAQATASGADVTVNLPDGDHIEAALPQSLVRYVMRTRETVILEDASSPNLFSADPYLAKHGARSILCLPLISQGKLVGVLYLENNLAPRVFGPARIAMLELLASQAAISLENTRLYRDLAQREAKIRRLVDANIVGIMFWDVDGGIRDANEAFLRMVGYESADLVSGRLRWTDLTPAEWLERDRQIVEAQVRLTGHVPPYEKEFFRKDGSRVPVLIGGTVFDNENKYGIAFVVDITARKRAEEELRRSQHYLAEAQKVSHTGSWAWSLVSNDILYWSEECYRILGYDPAQGLPSFESSFERIHPEDRPDLAATIERAAREKTEFQIEYRLVLPDDTGRIVRLLSHPVLDASGEVAEFVGTVMDVTEHKRAEEDRREHLWFLESMDRINRAMQRSNDVELMTSGVMQQALEIFACNRACLIYPCDPDTPTYRTVMEHASPEYNGALTLGQDVPVPSEGTEILRRALHHPEAVIDPSLPPEIRERFRIASMLAIAVHPKGDRPYLLVVYSSRSRPWTAAELRLFEEIARRLGDALTSVLAHRNLIAREKELRRSQQYLAEGQRLSHTGSWAWNPTTNEVPYWSQESYRIYDFDPAQGIPPFETTWERVHPEDRDALREAIERGLREKAGFQVEHRLVLPDATVRYHRVLAHPVLDASGELVEYLGTVVDITEQKRAEEERKEHLWFLESMDRINRAMQRTNDMEGMMSGVLKETLDIFDSDRARLVYPCDPDAALTRVVMEHSRPEYPGAFALGEDVPMDRHAADFLRRVLDSPGTATELSFPPEMRERFRIQSAIAIAVRPKGDRPYLFGLHQCSYARTWTAPERRLFEEIARRLEDALTSVLAHRNLLAREEELRQSEAYLAEAQKLSQTGSWAWSPDQDIRYWSEECYRVLSFDPQGGLPRFEDFLQRIHPDDQPGFREVIRTAIYKKAEWETDYRIVHPDGPVRDIHVVAHPVLSTSGHLVEFVGTVIDVTERRRAEQRLVAQHRVARILAEAATMEEATPKILQAVCESMRWDVGVHWRVDREAEALSCAEVWRKPSVEAAQLEAVTRARTFRLGEGTLGRVWASRAPAYISDAVHGPDFGARAEMSAAGLRAAFALPILMGSEVLGVLGFFSRDVWQADQDLLDMMATIGSQIGQFCKRTAAVDELQLRVSMLQNIPVAAWSVRPDGTPDIVNQLWFEYTGQTPEDVNAHPEAWMGTLHPEDREKASQNYWDGIRSGQGFTTEARFLRARDGTYRWHLNRAVPVLDAEGNIVRFVGTSTDVHDWRQAQEALRNTQAEFAHMTRVMTMGELTASIAHEVNQPLGAIVTSAAAGARWLATKPPQLDKANRALERIANDGKRAGEVIRRIRALMKRQAPRKEWLAINETILEVITLAQHQLRQSEILLETRLAQDLPLVRGDRVQLQQVLLNLIINAIDAMCAVKERPRELTIASTADGADAVSVEVRDSGTGLDPEHAAHLFEPFYTTKAEGLGVGLSISRSIVEAHGGQLSAAANAPHGTVFRFSLPVNEPAL